MTSKILLVLSILFIVISLLCQIFVEGFDLFGSQMSSAAFLIAVLKVSGYFIFDGSNI